MKLKYITMLVYAFLNVVSISLTAQLSNKGQYPKTIHFNEVNSKAAREFVKTYKEVEAKWYLTDKDLVAYFTKDSIQTHVFYDQKGNYMNKVSYYNENKLALDIRHIVRTNYYDYKIYYIAEVHSDDTIVYVVILEDDVCWKKIKIINNEARELETIKKS